MNAGAQVAHARVRPGAPDWRSLYPFSSHNFDASGHRLHYLDEGPRDAPVLLLVHGNPTWSFYFRSVVSRFRDRFRVVAPDHVGCGLSDKPQDFGYRLADHVSNLEQLVRALDLTHVTLLVHDWGGPIGLGAAGRLAERFERLVVTNSAAFPSSRIPFRIAVCRLPGLGPLAVRGWNGFARAATFMATARGLEPAVAAGLLAPYASWAERIAIQRFVEDIPMRPSHPSFSALLEVEASLAGWRDKPVLILWGERDFCFTPAFRGEWQRRLPRAEVATFAEAGHYLLEDAREGVLGALERFLAPKAA